MRSLISSFCLSLFLFAASNAAADSTRCWLVTTTGSLDISDGTEVTAELVMLGLPIDSISRLLEDPTYLKVGVDVTDADNGISNFELRFEGAQSLGGQYRKVPLCSDAAPQLTCGAVNADWNPTTAGNGKNWWIKPVDWGFPYGKITVTTTGHGASDTAVLTVYGCKE